MRYSFVPDTIISFPNYVLRQKKVLRKGSGVKEARGKVEIIRNRGCAQWNKTCVVNASWSRVILFRAELIFAFVRHIYVQVVVLPWQCLLMYMYARTAAGMVN